LRGCELILESFAAKTPKRGRMASVGELKGECPVLLLEEYRSGGLKSAHLKQILKSFCKKRNPLGSSKKPLNFFRNCKKRRRFNSIRFRLPDGNPKKKLLKSIPTTSNGKNITPRSKMCKN